jgi:hypothetical protein
MPLAAGVKQGSRAAAQAQTKSRPRFDVASISMNTLEAGSRF